MKISDHLTRAFYAVAGRDAEYVLANTRLLAATGTRAQIGFAWCPAAVQPVISLPTDAGPITIFHELAHAYHIHHWPVVSHFCAGERCEEAASCLTWMAAYVGVLDYRRVEIHDRAVKNVDQRCNLAFGQGAALDWHARGRQQSAVNEIIRGVLHADLR